MTSTTMHPFEAAGLGQAPFRFIGMVEKTYQACQGAPVQPGASCDYCGQGIRYVFQVKSADGKSFGVGCDCIRKTTHKGVRLLSDAEREMRRFKRDQAAEKLRARVAASLATLAANPALFTDAPHPSPFFAKQGKTWRDYVLWSLESGSTSGRLAACKGVEQAAA
jgi:hypothetical protein